MQRRHRALIAIMALGFSLGAAGVGPASAGLAHPLNATKSTEVGPQVTKVQWRRHHHWRHRHHWRRGYYGPGPAVGFGLAAGALIGGAIAAQSAAAQDADAYCASRYRSYDPASGTYLGYDALRHPCP